LQEFQSYAEIREWKDSRISMAASNTAGINEIHDEAMKYVFRQSVQKAGKGPDESGFVWFVTGSGGRLEQGVISDQDHGIVYTGGEEEAAYFQELGQELSYGLNETGYPYCEGKVMSSSPLWRKTAEDWKGQLKKWINEESWESIRYLQIFYDARALEGSGMFIRDLKSYVHAAMMVRPRLLKRLAENSMHIKPAVGPLGQILIEEKGKFEGCIDLKQTAFLPYVNSIRLLAMKEGLFETSTLERISRLAENAEYRDALEKAERNFRLLLSCRESIFSLAGSYETSRYLNVKKLPKEERAKLRNILKSGKKLHQFVQAKIEKGVQ
jgi:CBS domain-containing protein